MAIMYMDDIDQLLEQIRANSITQSLNNKKRYMVLKSRLKWYRLFVIIFSAINSVFSIGLQPYMEQGTISIVNSGIALACGIVGSVELYLQINKQMEQTLISSKDFYVLSTDIYRYLHLKTENRSIQAGVFIDESYNRYIKLIQSSLLLKKKIDDKLTGSLELGLNGFKLVPSLESLVDTSSDDSN